MQALDRILRAARAAPARIVLPEGTDGRILAGAARAARAKIAQIILLGPVQTVEPLWRHHAGDWPCRVIDPHHSPQLAAYADAFFDLRRHKGLEIETARAAMLQPLQYAAMMVRQGDAEATLGGAVATTADTVRAALQIIGLAPSARLVSSFFLMLLCESHHPVKGPLVFADCGLVVDPDAEELAEIALASAHSYAALTGEEPKVAMLSFSTAGSARHAKVHKVIQALDQIRAADPGLIVDGEIQFDAAFSAAVGASKAPASPLKGEANVFIFPNLDAANIGYKIAQRIGGAKAFGPVLQGLARPANDLSRGCSAEDVFYMIALTAVQAAAVKTGEPSRL